MGHFIDRFQVSLAASPVVLGVYDGLASLALAPLRLGVALIERPIQKNVAGIPETPKSDVYASLSDRPGAPGSHEVASRATRTAWIRGIYRTLEPLLLQWPLVTQLIERGQPVEVSDLLALWVPLQDLLQDLELFVIGAPGVPCGFDPAWHEAPANCGVLEAGTPVLVRQVGYRHRDQVLRRAKVRLPE